MSDNAINFGSERNRQRYERLTPEQRAAFDRIRAQNRTPEKRAEEKRVRELAEQEFPPLAANEQLLMLVATFRTERERQGLSLSDVAERTGMDRAQISKLELGKVANPTLGTLRTYAHALGLELEWTARPMEPTA